MDLAAELQKIYDSEINIEMGWLWDGGINLHLGDPMNGYLAEENVSSVSEILLWLQEAIAHFYPTSTYAIGLDPGIRERAVRRIFRPPRVGAQVFCPHCGTPNAHPAWTRSFSSTVHAAGTLYRLKSLRLTDLIQSC